MITRRVFLKYTTTGTMLTLFGCNKLTGVSKAIAQIPGGSLDPLTIPKYQTSLLIPPVGTGTWTPRMWADAVTENPALGATEVWELHNATADAHPMHIHEIVFEVVDRQAIVVDEDARTVQVDTASAPRPREAWETGFKDTVIAYPGQVTRVRAQFNTPGQFVWHCHIVEHEDNEMMRPYRIGPVQPGQPGQPDQP